MDRDGNGKRGMRSVLLDGMDLWLVESLGGEMTVDRPGSSGARVTLAFEPRSPDAAGGR